MPTDPPATVSTEPGNSGKLISTYFIDWSLYYLCYQQVFLPSLFLIAWVTIIRNIYRFVRTKQMPSITVMLLWGGGGIRLDTKGK